MVVRLKDIRSGQASENKKGGIVRLSDIRKKEEAKAVEYKKTESERLSDSYKKYKQETNSFGAPMLDPSKSPIMQQIEQYNVDHPYGKQELQSPAHNNVPKSAAKVEPTGWNGILDNPIGRGIGKGFNAVDVLTQDIAKFATPDAPMFTKDGKLDPNMTARQQFMKDNPQKTTGSAGLDKALNVGGHLGSIFVPIGTGGALINDIGKGASALLSTKLGTKAVNGAADLVNPALNSVGINLSNKLAANVGQGFAKGAVLGAGYGAAEPLTFGEGNLSDVPKSMLDNALMFGAGDAALPFLGAGAKFLLGKGKIDAKLPSYDDIALSKPITLKPKIESVAPPASNLKRLDQIRAEVATKETNIPENANGKPLNIESANNNPIRLSNEEVKRAGEAKLFNETDIGDINSFRSKVSRDLKKDKTTFAQKSEQIRTQFVDDLAPLEGLEKRVTGKVASAENSLYKSARLYRGVPEKANQIVKERLSPIVNNIEKLGYSSKDLGDYALAIHAKDVNARDIKSGFTNKEIENVINKLGTPEMEAARKNLVQLNDDMLKQLVDRQVITQDLVNTLKERYPNYMPLFRQLEDDAVGFQGGLSNALANVSSPIKGLKGSEKKVIEPLENMVKNVFQSTNAAERNKVGLQFTELSKLDAENKFIRRLDDSEGVGRKNVISVLENGKKVRYEVEPEVYNATLNLDKESSNMLIKVLQKPASLLRAGATLTPEFSLRNPLRDVVQAFVVSESGFNPLIDFPVGLIQSISKGNLYKKWVDELGAFGNIISNDRQVHKEALERVLKESASKKFVNIVSGKSLIKLLRSITDVTESATKIGEFRASLRKGTTPQEAAYRSRDIMDFGRSGGNIRQTNKIVAFLNANIQGKSKLLRAFKANPVGFTARAFSSITVPTVGVFLMQKYMANDEQKKTIDESPSWLTDSFWLVPVPGTNQVARIPKPFDIGTLFSNLPERALKYTYNNDKEAFDGFAKKALADGALPGMISGLTPFIEGMSNFSFFRGGTIIPQREEGVNFGDQYDVNTTETAKGLAKVAGAVTGGKGAFKNFSSPRIMDNTIKGLTAGLGSYATSAIDVMLEKFNLTDNPKRPANNIDQQPLAKAFLVNPNQSGKSTEQLYNLKTDLTTDKGSAKLRGEEFKQGPKLDYINEQTGIMGDIGTEIRSIEKDMKLSPKQKRDKIDVLVKKRNEIAIKAMDYIKSKND